MDDAARERIRRGENAAAEITHIGLGDDRVALFFALVRDLPHDRLCSLLHSALHSRNTTNPAEAVVDIFVMAFQTRNCRGGKGERRLFFWILLELATTHGYLATVIDVLPLLPQYGTFKDWFSLLEELNCCYSTTGEQRMRLAPLENAILDLAKTQLLADSCRLETKESLRLVQDDLEDFEIIPSKNHMLPRGCEGGSSSSFSNSNAPSGISLLAKWAPREKRAQKRIAKRLTQRMFPESSNEMERYRKLLSKLNKALQTAEILMSENRWDEIDFTKVPALALMKYRKAFINERLTGPPPKLAERETGNRHPNDPARVACRKRIRETMLSTRMKLKGRQVYPHKITEKLMRRRGQQNMSVFEKDLLHSQWCAIRESVKEAMVETRSIAAASAAAREDDAVMVMSSKKEGDNARSIDLGKCVAMIDVSSSMRGTPIHVATALGLLVSELSDSAFANRCITFAEMPSWVLLEPEASIAEKCDKITRSHWGYNTNFEVAMEMILERSVKARLQPDQIPSLIVFSGMQFDQAHEHDVQAARSPSGFVGTKDQVTDEFPFIFASDLAGRRKLLRFDDYGTLAPGEENVRLIHLHYNGYGKYWDEWVRSDSSRFRGKDASELAIGTRLMLEWKKTLWDAFVVSTVSPEEVIPANGASPICGSGSWETQHERIVRRFKETGMKVCGKEWPAPEMIYWNLRGDTVGFPVAASTPGVRMLSGFSPVLLKLLLDGQGMTEELVQVEDDDGNVVVDKPSNDPYETVRKALDDKEYDAVRLVLGQSNEGPLAAYKFAAL